MCRIVQNCAIKCVFFCTDFAPVAGADFRSVGLGEVRGGAVEARRSGPCKTLTDGTRGALGGLEAAFEVCEDVCGGAGDGGGDGAVDDGLPVAGGGFSGLECAGEGCFVAVGEVDGCAGFGWAYGGDGVGEEGASTAAAAFSARRAAAWTSARRAWRASLVG